MVETTAACLYQTVPVVYVMARGADTEDSFLFFFQTPNSNLSVNSFQG